jgi:hypothetical protein
MTLDQATELIMNAVKDTLVKEIEIDGGKLSDVKSVFIDRGSQSPKTPSLWIAQGDARLIPEDNYLHTEYWAMEIGIVSVVYNTTEQGYKEANSLVCRAKEVLIRDRTLGFGHGTFFSDIRSLRYTGSNPQFKNGNYYSSLYTCEVYFIVN